MPAHVPATTGVPGDALARWRGKTALVTGASSGIGWAIAEDLARHGVKVVACARREQRLQQLVAAVGSDEGSLITPRVCDLLQPGAIDGLFDELAAGEGVDILINNAGHGRGPGLLDGNIGAWREMLELNVLALSHCTQRAVADLRGRGVPGHIVHVSSMSSHRVPRGGGMYSASKYAVRALTEGLRQELQALGLPIRVTAVSPGFVETEFAEVQSGSAAQAAKTYARYPCLQADDIAQAVRFVLGVPQHMQVHDILVRPTAQPD